MQDSFLHRRDYGLTFHFVLGCRLSARKQSLVALVELVGDVVVDVVVGLADQEDQVGQEAMDKTGDSKEDGIKGGTKDGTRTMGSKIGVRVAILMDGDHKVRF